MVNSISEMQEALRHTPEYGQGPDVWIEGWGFDESKLAEHRSPTRDDLDQVSTTQPIFLYRSDCHSSVGNSRALELSGIDEHTPEPAGGKIEKDASGRPTGFMREVAVSQLLIRAKSALSYEDKENILFSLSSDAPCTPWAEPDSPFYGIYAAVTRHTAAGGFINEDEGIPVVRAILAYTRDAAKMGGFVNNGTLTPGKDADFVILDRDIFSQKLEDLAKVKPASTWIGGEKVWSQKKK